jgi:hypothetical protein
VTCVVCGATLFDVDVDDFFAGLPIVGDAINAPAAKQLMKINPLVFIPFPPVVISLSDSWLLNIADASRDARKRSGTSEESSDGMNRIAAGQRARLATIMA